MRINLKTFITLVSMSAACFGNEPQEYLHYEYAIVRALSPAFEDSLKLAPPPAPIDIDLARKQHENYIQVLEKLITHVIRVEADPQHPDCNFIEDTAIIAKDIAVISRMGAVERRGEELPVASLLDQLGFKTVWLQVPATMDGGDILFTGRHMFVGLSKRTNIEALSQLQEIFRGVVEVVGIPVLEGLHLKSVVSLFDSNTLIVADSIAGNKVREQIQQLDNSGYTFITVPNAVASNVLRIGSYLLIQDGFPESEKILAELCDRKLVNMVKLNMSELIKADGALTCGSLLMTKVQSNSVLQRTNRYMEFCNRIGNGESFEPFEEIAHILAPNSKKIFNGRTVSENRDDFVSDLLSVHDTYGNWKSTALEIIESENSVVLRTIIEAKSLGTHTAIVILRFDSNGLITEINEVCSPVQDAYDFNKN